MVTIDKVQRGLTMFIDREMVPVLTGWDKVLIGGGAGLAVAKLPKILAQYPVLSVLDIYDKENNLVDIDTLYQVIVPQIGTESLPAKIPVLNMTMKIGRNEIDALYRYIKEA